MVVRVRTALGQTLFLGILIGLIFLRLGNRVSETQSKLGGKLNQFIKLTHSALFFMVVNQAFGSVTAIVTLCKLFFSTPLTYTVPNERNLFFREHNNKMYNLFSFYVSKNLSDLPWQILWPFLFTTISY